MNTRIDKLWGQALDQCVPETWAALDSAQLSRIKEKFAELIVRECASMARVYRSHEFDFTGDLELDEFMLKHFGVEE